MARIGCNNWPVWHHEIALISFSDNMPLLGVVLIAFLKIFAEILAKFWRFLGWLQPVKIGISKLNLKISAEKIPKNPITGPIASLRFFLATGSVFPARR